MGDYHCYHTHNQASIMPLVITYLTRSYLYIAAVYPSRKIQDGRRDVILEVESQEAIILLLLLSVCLLCSVSCNIDVQLLCFFHCKIIQIPDDVDFQVSTSSLSARWSGFAHSHLSLTYEVGVGTSPGTFDVVVRTVADSNNQHVEPDLNLMSMIVRSNTRQ